MTTMNVIMVVVVVVVVVELTKLVPTQKTFQQFFGNSSTALDLFLARHKKLFFLKPPSKSQTPDANSS